MRISDWSSDVCSSDLHRLPVDALHTLHVEECGNPLGLPVVFLHGGPGAGLSTYHRRFFDPARYRIVLFDQRGCGQPTPFAELPDRKSVGEGKSVAVRVDRGGRRVMKNKMQ